LLSWFLATLEPVRFSIPSSPLSRQNRWFFDEPADPWFVAKVIPCDFGHPTFLSPLGDLPWALGEVSHLDLLFATK
jgi:hypothetical protein